MRILYPLVLTTCLLVPATPAVAEEFKTVKPSAIMEEVIEPAARAGGKTGGSETAKTGNADEGGLKKKMLDQKVSEHFQQGMIYQSMGAPEQAIQFYQQALKTDPKFVSTYNNLAQCLIARNREGDQQQALNLLAEAIKLDPDNVGTLHAFAVLKERNKEYKAAEEAYSKVLHIQPLNMRAIQNLCEMYFSQGQKEKARGVILEAMKHNPPEQAASIFKQALANLDKKSAAAKPGDAKTTGAKPGTASGANRKTASK